MPFRRSRRAYALKRRRQFFLALVVILVAILFGIWFVRRDSDPLSSHPFPTPADTDSDD
jgi:flagellar biogenesis protein FliO